MTIDLTKTAKPEIAFMCSECLEVQSDSNGPIYECGNCGETFSKEDEGTHRCPNCGKFASKLCEDSVDCGCNAEAEEITAYRCENCDNLIPADDAETHECIEPDEHTAEQRYVVGEILRSSGVWHTESDGSPCAAVVEVLSVGERSLAVRCTRHKDKLAQLYTSTVQRPNTDGKPWMAERYYAAITRMEGREA